MTREIVRRPTPGEVDCWSGSSPASDEIPIDTELVRALVRRAMPEHAQAPVRRLATSGSTNALFRLGDELRIRLPRQPGGSASISMEARWLPRAGPRLPVAVPDVVAVFEPADDFPERWSVMRWINGEHLEPFSPDAPVAPARQVLAENLAAVLQALHQVDVPPDANEDRDLE